jgi:hypothetical protein
VATAALQGLKSQPPIYLMLVEKWKDRWSKDKKEVSFSYLYVESEEPKRSLSAEEWTGCKNEILETIHTQLGEMEKGHFPILPGSYCAWCDVVQICRKNDSLSAYRTEFGPAETLAKLRSKKA